MIRNVLCYRNQHSDARLQVRRGEQQCHPLLHHPHLHYRWANIQGQKCVKVVFDLALIPLGTE